MTTALIKTLPLAAFLLAAASGCELINFDAPIIVPPYDDNHGDAGGPTGPKPLLPFKPGNIWQYTVTNLDGTSGYKYITIDDKMTMVGGVGAHQTDMAYPVKTRYGGLNAPISVITLQVAVGDQVLNYRKESFNQQNQIALDEDWEPHLLEIDQSTERTRPGATWLESYTQVSRPLGGVPTTVKQSEPWTVVGQELLALPRFDTPFETIVFQKGAVTNNDAGTGTGDGSAGDGGKVGDGGVGRPMLTGESWSAAPDSGVVMPKTLWYARGVGKVKEAGGGGPTEELYGAILK